MPPKRKPAAPKRKAAPKKKAAAKKSGTKKRATPEAFKQTFKPDAALAAVVGTTPRTRGQFMKKIWEYIKANKLQDPANGQYIIPDAKLKAVFGATGKVHMTKVPGAVSKHIS